MNSTRRPRRPRDPFKEREAQRYERPIASRELILQVLEEASGPLQFEEVGASLRLTDEVDLEALRRRLRAMERDGQIVRNRREAYLPVDQSALVRGHVVGHRDGYGFLDPDDGGDGVFLSPRQMRKVMHGDRAVARVVGLDRRGRREGSIVEVLERNTERVVGRYQRERGIGFVAPDNPRIQHDVLIPPEHVGSAQPGQIVVAELIEQPHKGGQPIGRVAEILGEHMAPGMEIDIAVRAHGIPHEWPEAVLHEAAALGEQVPEDAKRGRKDLRDLPLVTIDGEDARDFDDAVYCARKGRGWRLIVAIADVSHYVEPGSALDEEAQRRGTSVYFPERVVPMLPEALSNGLCSINPEVDRLCLACEMEIDERGALRDFRFFEAVMRSHARLTYTEVGEILEARDPQARERRAALVPQLEELHALYGVLREARERRGAIDFDTTETRIVFGPERKIERIAPVQRNDAHKLIEECMIAANVAAARYLQAEEMPALYRVHDGPKPERLEDLRSFLGELGLSLAGGDDPEPGDYTRLLTQIRSRDDAHLIQTVLLRSLSQAVYSPDNAGHFGLAHSHYAHFTSPIRRYPDLLVHRAIRHRLRRGKPASFRYGHADMVMLGDHCSMTERRADEATRAAVDWLKCEFMLDKLGESFDGVISAVTSFGLFIQLKDIYVEGLLHVTALENDYYEFDAAGHRLRGKRGGRVFRLGDPIRVRVARVDLDERKIDFLPDAAEREGPSKKGGGRRGRARRR